MAKSSKGVFLGGAMSREILIECSHWEKWLPFDTRSKCPKGPVCYVIFLQSYSFYAPAQIVHIGSTRKAEHRVRNHKSGIIKKISKSNNICVFYKKFKFAFEALEEERRLQRLIQIPTINTM